MSDDYEPHFEFYPIELGDKRAFIRVDVGLHELGADPDRPVSLRFRVVMNEPSELGLTTPDEAEVLIPFEDKLLAAVPEATLAGVMTRDGRRDWFFYCRDPEVIGEAAEAARQQALPDHVSEIGVLDDPEWNQYYTYLYPNALAWQFITDNHLLLAMQEHGDDGSVARRIDHWAYFPTRRQRRSYIRLLQEDGFVIDGKRTVRGDQHAYGISFHHPDAWAPANIHRRTEKLAYLAMECEGSYDGWETRVVAGESGADPVG